MEREREIYMYTDSATSPPPFSCIHLSSIRILFILNVPFNFFLCFLVYLLSLFADVYKSFVCLLLYSVLCQQKTLPHIHTKLLNTVFFAVASYMILANQPIVCNACKMVYSCLQLCEIGVDHYSLNECSDKYKRREDEEEGLRNIFTELNYWLQRTSTIGVVA